MSVSQNLKERVMEASRAVKDVVDTTFVPEEISSKRLTICKECQHLFHPTNTCKKCGCFMDIKTKMFWAKCPIGKWSDYTSQ